MKTRFAVLPFALLMGFAMQGCTDSKEELPRLEFSSTMPKELTVGDTTDALFLTKVFVNPLGRQDEKDDYSAFTFESTDTNVVRIVDGRRLVGVAVGTASISAFDNQSSGKTKGGRDVTVKPLP